MARGHSPEETTGRDTPRRSKGRAWLRAGAGLLLAPAVLLGAGAGTGSAALAQATPTPARAAEVAVDSILDDPGAFFGKPVRLSGEVDAALGLHAFTVEDGDFVFDDDLLVLSRRPLSGLGGVPADTITSPELTARVTGTVRRFARADLARELGVLFEEDPFARWEGRPVVVADSVRLVPDVPGVPPVVVEPRGATVDEILDTPVGYYGRYVRVHGEVGDVVGPHAFTVEDSDPALDEAMLVLSPSPLGAVPGWAADGAFPPEATAWATGVVRRFDRAALAQDLGLTLDETQFAAWAGRPVLVAQAVTIAPDTETPPLPPGPVGIGAPWALPRPTGATVDDILDDPAAYYGRFVRVNGESSGIVGPNAVSIEDSDVFFDDDLLVLTTVPLATSPGWPVNGQPAAEATVWASGVVRRFDRAVLEAEYGLTLDDAGFTAWDGRPVLVATSVAFAG